MVRTLRSIQEEARVKQIRDAGSDAALADPAMLEALEGKTLQEMLAWAKDGARRALVVGLEDRGRIALELAAAGVFVTIVDPDESLHAPVMKAAEEARCSIRVNSYVSEYMTREFTSSGFDVATFFSVLSRYNEPMIVLKKAARELRAGGRLFARVRVRPGVEPVLQKLRRIPLWDKATALILRRVPMMREFLSLPDAGQLLAEVGEIFKVEHCDREHLLAAEVIGLSRSGPLWSRDALSRAVPLALKIDATAMKIPQVDRLATHLVLYGLKELGLGKTFSMKDR